MRISTGRRLAGAAVLLTATACGGNSLGSLEDVFGTVLGQPSGANQGQLSVEIRGVDTQQQTIRVETQEGQTGSVRYDQNTVVVYQQQQYPVTALEVGDLAVIHVQDAQGTTYVSRIEVQQSVQDRSGVGSGNVVQLSGRVAQINHDTGTFVLQTQNGNVTVTLPYNAPQATVNYFHQLRNGHNVRVEVTPITSGRAEVYRFL